MLRQQLRAVEHQELAERHFYNTLRPRAFLSKWPMPAGGGCVRPTRITTIIPAAYPKTELLAGSG